MSAGQDILSDISNSLASPLCTDYLHYTDGAEAAITATVTSADYTVTSTLAPMVCSAIDEPSGDPAEPAQST